MTCRSAAGLGDVCSRVPSKTLCIVAKRLRVGDAIRSGGLDRQASRQDADLGRFRSPNRVKGQVELQGGAQLIACLPTTTSAPYRERESTTCMVFSNPAVFYGCHE